MLSEVFWVAFVTTISALDGSVKSSIDKIKPTNYENYFIYAYNKDYYKNKLNNKKYTRRRTLTSITPELFVILLVYIFVTINSNKK